MEDRRGGLQYGFGPVVVIDEFAEELSQPRHVLGVAETGPERRVAVEIEAKLAVVPAESAHDEPCSGKPPPGCAVLVDAGGNLVEGPGFNVFVRHGNTVITPSRGVLEGVTRETILELLDRENLEVRQELLPAATARAAVGLPICLAISL